MTCKGLNKSIKQISVMLQKVYQMLNSPVPSLADGYIRANVPSPIK